MSKRSRYLIERDNVARPREVDGCTFEQLTAMKEQEALACVRRGDRTGALAYATEAYVLRGDLREPIAPKSIHIDTLRGAHAGSGYALDLLRQKLLPEPEHYDGSSKVEDAIGALIVSCHLAGYYDRTQGTFGNEEAVTLSEWALFALREALLDTEEAAAEYLEQAGVTTTEETDND